ncbi:MAG: hypothetical protein ACFFG0_05255 [Candidatus Thorarchaeota archaeon]
MIITSNLDSHFSELKKSQLNLSENQYYEPKIATKTLLKSASPVVTTQSASYYHPLYEPINLQLPTKLREINQWARYFRRTDPLVNNALSLHSEFPVTGFRNLCDDPSIQKFYDNLAFDILKLPQLLSFISSEYNGLGNVFPMGMWDDSKGHWLRFITLNPDYVEIEKNIFADKPILRLDPDDSLRKIIQNRAPRDIYEKLDPKVIEYISKSMKVPLSSFYIQVSGKDGVVDEIEIPQVTHLSNATSMYEAYGLPYYFCVFKVLIYKDILRRAQHSIAKRHWKPVKVVKVGDETHHANNNTLSDVKEALDQASSDPESWFIWHNYVNFDYIASAGHVMPLNSEYEWVNKELYSGLEVNEAILTGGGVSFSNASVALRIMINKYKRFQKKLSTWVIENIYKPVAKVQQFYKVGNDGEQELIYPEIEWEMMRLQDDAQQKALYERLHKAGIISKKTFLTYLGLDPEKEKELVKQEQEDDLKYIKDIEKKKKELIEKKPAKEPIPPPPGGMGELPPPPIGGEELAPPSPMKELPMGGGMPGETKPPEATEEITLGT